MSQRRWPIRTRPRIRPCSGPAAAQTLPERGERTCWGRAYTQTHLQAHPGQHIQQMILVLDYPAEFDQVNFQVRAVTVDDPYTQWLTDGGCHQEPGSANATCYVWCDGGGFDLAPEAGGDSLLLLNHSFALSSCGEPMESEDDPDAFMRLDADAENETYRLYRLRPEMCGGE